MDTKRTHNEENERKRTLILLKKAPMKTNLNQRTQSGQDRDINGTFNDAKRTLMGRTPLCFG